MTPVLSLAAITYMYAIGRGKYVAFSLISRCLLMYSAAEAHIGLTAHGFKHRAYRFFLFFSFANAVVVTTITCSALQVVLHLIEIDARLAINRNRVNLT